MHLKIDTCVVQLPACCKHWQGSPLPHRPAAAAAMYTSTVLCSPLPLKNCRIPHERHQQLHSHHWQPTAGAVSSCVSCAGSLASCCPACSMLSCEHCCLLRAQAIMPTELNATVTPGLSTAAGVVAGVFAAATKQQKGLQSGHCCGC